MNLIDESIDLALRVRPEDDEDPQWATCRLRLGCEHLPARQQAALASLGMTLLPRPYAAEALQQGRLVQVMPGWSAPAGHLQGVCATRRGMLPAIRALIDALAAMPGRP